MRECDCFATVSDLTAGVDVERKRHISAPDESHSDSESTTLLSRHEPSSAVQLLPRPRSSAALDDFIDSSTHAAASADVEELVANVTGSATSVCTAIFLRLLLLRCCYQCHNYDCFECLPLPSNRHLSYDVHREVKREDIRTVQCCVQQLCTTVLHNYINAQVNSYYR